MWKEEKIAAPAKPAKSDAADAIQMADLADKKKIVGARTIPKNVKGVNLKVSK
jgi:hypothetical protein